MPTPLPTRFNASFQDLTGKTFNLLTVISFAGFVKRKSRWNCLCRCGKEKTTYGYRLSNGGAKSCGCLVGGKKTHGRSRTPEFNIWRLMLERCEDQRSKSYKDYGARGIKVCERWHDLENFIADMGMRPDPKLTLDRINNELGYSPENCRWATRHEQAMNKRLNRLAHLITHEGTTRTLAEWRRITGLNESTISTRIARGWSVADALTLPAIRCSLIYR